MNGGTVHRTGYWNDEPPLCAIVTVERSEQMRTPSESEARQPQRGGGGATKPSDFWPAFEASTSLTTTSRDSELNLRAACRFTLRQRVRLVATVVHSAHGRPLALAVGAN